MMPSLSYVGKKYESGNKVLETIGNLGQKKDTKGGIKQKQVRFTNSVLPVVAFDHCSMRIIEC